MKKRTETLKHKALKQELLAYLNTFGTCKTEHQFDEDKKRRFKFDYAIVDCKIAIEVNGGQWVNGRHNRGGKGYEDDLTKLNLAQSQGWHVLQYTYEMLERLAYQTDIERILKE